MAFDALRVVVVLKRMKIYEVIGLGIGCFRELSAGFNYACTFIARNRAVSYMNHNKSPKEALGMFRSRIRRVWGSCGHFRLLQRLYLGSQPKARWPAVARRLR